MPLRHYGREKASENGDKSEDLPWLSHTEETRGQVSVKAQIMLLSFIVSAGLLSADLHVGVEAALADTLHSVTVTADKGVVVSRTDTLSFSNSFTVPDVLQLNPGIHLGDNGGFAGLKTISMRGMGSAHTSVYIDGVRLGNVQSGQNDLGMIGLHNLESAVVDYAQNSVSFNTARPRFDDGPFAGNVRLNAGSFGSYLPSARIDFRLSDRISMSASMSGVFSKGDYGLSDGKERQNNDLEQVRAGLDLFGKFKEGDYHLKAYYNASERGTPGSVDWPSDDRQKDVNTFIQGVLRKSFSSIYTLRLSAKGSYDDIYYTSSWGDSRYGQTELQLNTSHDFQLRRWLKITLAADLQWDGLKSSSYDASRITAFSALASSFRMDRFSADLSLEYNGAFDKGAHDRQAFSPSLGLRYRLLDGLDIIGFSRRAYRTPTFNELYYAGYGNPDLKPEDIWMNDVGLDFHRVLGYSWTLKMTLDGYCNMLKNKIISAPSENDPNIWMPYNVGKVTSKGVDVVAGLAHKGEWNYSINIKWAFQSALDMTTDSHTYGEQIPYIARHTVILDASASWRGWSLIPLWQLRSGRTDGTGDLPDWNTLDVSLSRMFKVGKSGTLVASIMSKNILDKRYEVVSGYPMPGRSIMCGIEFKF